MVLLCTQSCELQDSLIEEPIKYTLIEGDPKIIKHFKSSGALMKARCLLRLSHLKHFKCITLSVTINRTASCETTICAMSWENGDFDISNSSI